MSTWNNPGKLETAMAAVVTALGLAAVTGEDAAPVVNTGQDDDDLDLPSVVCEVVGGNEEVVFDTGNFRSQVVVRVVTSATVTKADHQARAAAVFDTFISTDIASRLSAAVADFFVYEFRYQAPEIARREPRDENTFLYVSELTATVVWCGSDIS